MSADPYAGAGYWTGMVQARGQQLRGEARAEEIQREQEKLAYVQQMERRDLELRRQREEQRKREAAARAAAEGEKWDWMKKEKLRREAFEEKKFAAGRPISTTQQLAITRREDQVIEWETELEGAQALSEEIKKRMAADKTPDVSVMLRGASDTLSGHKRDADLDIQRLRKLLRQKDVAAKAKKLAGVPSLESMGFAPPGEGEWTPLIPRPGQVPVAAAPTAAPSAPTVASPVAEEVPQLPGMPLEPAMPRKLRKYLSRARKFYKKDKQRANEYLDSLNITDEEKALIVDSLLSGVTQRK